MGEAVEIFPSSNGFSNGCDDGIEKQRIEESDKKCFWYEEEIDDDLKWSFALNR